MILESPPEVSDALSGQIMLSLPGSIHVGSKRVSVMTAFVLCAG